MPLHFFLFSPGSWLGKGKIAFKNSPASIRFYLKWQISHFQEPFTILAHQKVEMEEVTEQVLTVYRLSNIIDSSFVIDLESESIGSRTGKGIFDEKTISWEFHTPRLEGFEIYEKIDDTDYRLHAEFSSAPTHRIIIDGTIWKKFKD